MELPELNLGRLSLPIILSNPHARPILATSKSLPIKCKKPKRRGKISLRKITPKLLSISRDIGVVDIELLDDKQTLKCTVDGPSNTVYAGGRFKVHIKCNIFRSEQHTAPIVIFKTPIWHPNIDVKDGYMAINTELSKIWKQRGLYCMKLRDTFVAIFLLLRSPNWHKSIKNQVVLKCKEDYEDCASNWVKMFAMDHLQKFPIKCNQAQCSCEITPNFQTEEKEIQENEIDIDSDSNDNYNDATLRSNCKQYTIEVTPPDTPEFSSSGWSVCMF